MKENAKGLMMLSLFVCLICFGYSSVFAAEVPPEVLQVARSGICDFIKAERSQGSVPYDAAQVQMLEDSELGYGFQVHTVTPGHLMNGTDLDSMLTPTGLWRFVVVSEGQPGSLITVARVQGNWTAVALGGRQLAAEVQRVVEAYPAAQGYTHRFIRVFQARSDFIQVSQKGKPVGYVPLSASRLAFQMDGTFEPGFLLKSSEVVEPLRRIVRERLRMTKPGTVK